jgi:hypothetical protein
VAAAYNAGVRAISLNGITNPQYVEYARQDVLDCAAGKTPR